jgi:hypothetical protein
MRKLLLCLVMTVLLSGCSLFCPSDEPLLREIRSTLIESTRPGLVDALDKARGPDGTPLYIDAYRNEKVNVVDQMVQSIDRLYPPVDESGNPAPYAPEPKPWGEE